VVEALLSESSKSLAVEALQEHMIQGHRNLGSRGAAAVFPWRFASIQMGYFQKEKDRFQRIMFQEFWQETLQAWLHLGEC